MDLFNFNETNNLLFEAIKKDNVKEFENNIKEYNELDISFGRFPILSLMYLYNSKKLINKYEDKLIALNKFTHIFPEETDAINKFREYAGRTIRVFNIDSFILPLEMLLCLGNTNKFRKIYPKSPTSNETKLRLSQIYSIKFGLSLEFDGKDLIMDKRPRTRKENRKLITTLVSIILVVAISISTPFIVNIFYPFINQGGPKDSPTRIVTVNDISKIDTSRNVTYKLESDLTITNKSKLNLSENVTCNIDGNNHKIIVNNGQTLNFGNLNKNRTISNLNIEYNSLNLDVTSNTSLFINDNNGTIENVNITINGGNINVKQLDASNADDEQEETPEITELNIAVCCLNNNGNINNVNVSLGDFNISGVSNIDTNFSGITTKNVFVSGSIANNTFKQGEDNVIENCSTSGNVTLNLVDAAGICYTNYGQINLCTNNINFTYNNNSDTWNPNVSGICQTTYQGINSCINNGNISVLDTSNNTNLTAIFAAGIANNSISHLEKVQNLQVYYYSTINECTNNGELIVNTNNKLVNLAGIVNICSTERIYNDYNKIISCINNGNITFNSKSSVGFVGGICSRNESSFLNKSSTSDGTEIRVTIENELDSSFGENTNNSLYIGGIAGISTYYFTNNINNSLINVDISKSNPNFYIGGAVGFTNSNTQNCTNNKNVTVLSNNSLGYVGGLIGASSSSTSDSTNLAQVSITGNGTIYAGGIAGYAVTLSKTNNSGNVNITNATGEIFLGGITGRLNSSYVTNSNNSGNVKLITETADGNVGGVVGISIGSYIQICNNNSDIQVESKSGEQNIGGIVGFISGALGVDGVYAVSSSVSSGNINTKTETGIENVGGIVGTNFGSTGTSFFNTVPNYIRTSKSTSSITCNGGNNYIGGIVGSNKTQISTTINNEESLSYASPNIIYCISETNIKTENSTESFVGGIVGRLTTAQYNSETQSLTFYSTVTRSFSLSNYDCDLNSNVGGIVGIANDKLIDSEKNTSTYIANNKYINGNNAIGKVINDNLEITDGNDIGCIKLEEDTLKKYKTYNQILVLLGELDTLPEESEMIDDTKNTDTTPTTTPEEETENTDKDGDSGNISY